MQMQAPDFTCKGPHPSIIGKRGKQSRKKKTVGIQQKPHVCGRKGSCSRTSARSCSISHQPQVLRMAAPPRIAAASGPTKPNFASSCGPCCSAEQNWRGSDAGAIIVMVAGSAATAHEELHAEVLHSHPVFGHGKHVGQLQRRRLRMCRGVVWSGVAGVQA